MTTKAQVLEILNQYDLEKTLWRRAMDSIWGGRSRSTAMTAVAAFMNEMDASDNIAQANQLTPDSNPALPSHIEETRLRAQAQLKSFLTLTGPQTDRLRDLIQLHRHNGGAATQRALTALEGLLNMTLMLVDPVITLQPLQMPQMDFLKSGNCCIVTTVAREHPIDMCYKAAPLALATGDAAMATDLRLATAGLVNLRLTDHSFALRHERGAAFFDAAHTQVEDRRARTPLQLADQAPPEPTEATSSGAPSLMSQVD